MNAMTHVHTGPRYLVALAACACLLYTGSALSAGPSRESASITVAFGDLNLATSAGAERLYGRIQNAARIVCGSKPFNMDLAGSRSWKSCYKSAVSGAVAAADLPTLTALHDSKSGRQSPQLAKR
jgi:UrcA family protein